MSDVFTPNLPFGGEGGIAKKKDKHKSPPTAAADAVRHNEITERLLSIFGFTVIVTVSMPYATPTSLFSKRERYATQLCSYTNLF